MTEAAADSGSAAPAPAAPRFHPGYAIAAVAVILAGIVGYGAWRFHVDFRTRLDSLAGELDAANAERQRLAADLDALRREAQAQTAAAERAASERKALAADVAGLKDDASRGRPAFDAVLAEAEYLAFVAGQRLTTDYDPAGAAAALQSADALLAGANRADLAPVRDQITRDREALAQASVPDIRQISLDITRAEHELDALPMRSAGRAAAAAGAEAAHTGWRGVLSSMWHDVLSLVQVRDVRPGDERLLDPARRAVLRQDLHQELAVAKYAALRRETADFRAAIGVVLAALRTTFDTEDAGVAALTSRLEEMRTLELAPPLPAIGGSLDALRAWRTKAAAAEGTAAAPAAGAGR